MPVPVDPTETLADAVCCDKRTKAMVLGGDADSVATSYLLVDIPKTIEHGHRNS